MLITKITETVSIQPLYLICMKYVRTNIIILQESGEYIFHLKSSLTRNLVGVKLSFNLTAETEFVSAMYCFIFNTE
jgi:hypothetical protein